MRLNKYLSRAGIASRRDADKLIASGLVKINGKVSTLGESVEENDIVTFKDKEVKLLKEDIFIAFNKPRGVVCTSKSFENETNIYKYIYSDKRIFAVGRLDKDSDGLLILTNNGDIANLILKSKNNVEKEYIVTVDKDITEDFITKMSNGIKIMDTVTKKCEVSAINKRVFNIILKQGLNRQIRRMCDSLGYNVCKLTRIRVANINLGDLELGKTRNLSTKEIETLKGLVNYNG